MAWGPNFRKRTYNAYKSYYGLTKPHFRSNKKPRTQRRRKSSHVINSNRGNNSFVGYKNRKLNKRRYKRILMDASLVGQHYRSLLGSALVTTTSPASILQGTANAIKMIASNFWTAAGGFSTSDFTAVPTFNDSDLFIRGGKSTISMINDSTTNIRVRSWRARTTMNGNTTALFGGVAVSAAWDPSHVTSAGGNVDFQKNYRFFDAQETILEPGDSMTRTAYIKAHKIDQDLFNADSQIDFWIYMVSNLLNSGAVSINVTVQHNITFTGDSGV